jgi:hypothetical protein
LILGFYPQICFFVHRPALPTGQAGCCGQVSTNLLALWLGMRAAGKFPQIAFCPQICFLIYPQISTDYLKFLFVSACLLASRFVFISGQSLVDNL